MLKKILKDFKKLHIVIRVLAVILVFLIGRWIYKGLIWGNWELNNYIIEGMKSINKDKATEFKLCHMTECGYCKKMMPDWDKLGSKVGNIKITKTERNEDPEMMDKYNVKGYPTIVLLDKNGTLLETYDGDRDYTSFMEYLS